MLLLKFPVQVITKQLQIIMLRICITICSDHFSSILKEAEFVQSGFILKFSMPSFRIK